MEYYNNTAVLAPCDYDQDGDVDVFVGSLCKTSQYGLFPDSYLLDNLGNGKFSVAEQTTFNNLGMITDAFWSDVDGDGDKDLLVVGHWMPITVFYNQSGRFQKFEIPNSAGWWNTIEPIDIDADGREDFILGNFGENNDLDVSEQRPLHLYIGDIDKNMTTDPIMTYTKDGQQHTLFGLDALSNQLVYLKRRFRTYQDFAQANFDMVFLESELQNIMHHQVQTLSNSILFCEENGKFALEALPKFAQYSTVYAISAESHLVSLYGNFKDVDPVIGKTGGSLGCHFSYDEGHFKEASHVAFTPVMGEVRDVKKIQTQSGSHYIVARNNNTLLLIKQPEDVQ